MSPMDEYNFATVYLSHIMPLAAFPRALPTSLLDEPASCEAFCREYADSRPLSLHGAR